MHLDSIYLNHLWSHLYKRQTSLTKRLSMQFYLHCTRFVRIDWAYFYSIWITFRRRWDFGAEGHKPRWTYVLLPNVHTCRTDIAQPCNYILNTMETCGFRHTGAIIAFFKSLAGKIPLYVTLLPYLQTEETVYLLFYFIS